ncbi:hypothetical protein HN873_038407 [Arachis hypogaea]
MRLQGDKSGRKGHLSVATEASQLQSRMIETMEAAELEKQKYNNTRMETANADLAKSLAAVQWNLEVEDKQVAELRQQIAFIRVYS